jgi:2,5-diketo-D-gluconate reductase A
MSANIAPTASIPRIPLNNGVEIPQLGFGTYKVSPEDAPTLIPAAVAAGYRHFDTADMYHNEQAVGAALAATGVPREELFVTTKLNNSYHRYDDALAAFDGSLVKLGMDYVDLFLIHWPLPRFDRYTEAWRALEEIYASGRARAIGVSNFEPHHLERIAESGTVVPAVNQIEVYPYFHNDDVRAYNAAHGIVTEAWSPLGRGSVLADPVIVEVANAHSKAPAQVVLRWHIQRGDVIFPKSASPERIVQNADIFDFELSDDDMAAINSLDRGERTGTHPDEEHRLGR